ncbi:hypothetical protein PM082_015170 [Marasmius tenuissimus]|nr:hypothetical protein PM082_015170 [Marasmius tenuissimus]
MFATAVEYEVEYIELGVDVILRMTWLGGWPLGLHHANEKSSQECEEVEMFSRQFIPEIGSDSGVWRREYCPVVVERFWTQ